MAELAIATAIIGLLLGGMFVTISTQLELRQISDTQRTLEQAREALIGYAQVNGRLPCPAAPAAVGSGTGTESPSGGGVCTNPYNGYLPGATLSLAPVDAQGYVLDSWGRRILYAITNMTNATCAASLANSFCFATTGMIRTEFPKGTLAPDLSVCSSSAGMTTGASAACAAANNLSSTAVAVLFSLGKNAQTSGGTGADEIKNIDNDRAFIWHEKAESGATNGEFDDIMVWLSPNTLYARMASSGSL